MSRTTAEILVAEAAAAGVSLRRQGDLLMIRPVNRCPAELKERLRKHKLEILSLLDAEAAGLKPDERPWLYVARQVLGGEFAGACMTSSLRESLVIGLRGIRHPTAQAALAKLQAWEEEAA